MVSPPVQKNAVNSNHCARFFFLSRAINPTDSFCYVAVYGSAPVLVTHFLMCRLTRDLNIAPPLASSSSFFVFLSSFLALLEKVFFVSLLSLARHCLPLLPLRPPLLPGHASPVARAWFLLFLLIRRCPPPAHPAPFTLASPLPEGMH